MNQPPNFSTEFPKKKKKKQKQNKTKKTRRLPLALLASPCAHALLDRNSGQQVIDGVACRPC
jgi:hypothetical protein